MLSTKIEISKTVLEGLINLRLTQEQIAIRLNKSATTIARRLREYGLKTNPIQNYQGDNLYKINVCRCKTCGCIDQDKFHFRDKQHTKLRTDICSICNAEMKQLRSVQNKTKAVELFGNRCNHCGFFSDIYQVYDFHHVDQSKKDSKQGYAFNPTWKWARIIQELQYCIMLCANCHRIIHAGRSNRGQIATTKSQYIIKCYFENKMRILDYYGNRCYDCHLMSEYHQIYDIHHLDPTMKELTLHDLKKRSQDNIIDELVKCVLLCANCHRIRHAKL